VKHGSAINADFDISSIIQNRNSLFMVSELEGNDVIAFVTLRVGVVKFLLHWVLTGAIARGYVQDVNI